VIIGKRNPNLNRTLSDQRGVEKRIPPVVSSTISLPQSGLHTDKKQKKISLIYKEI
jgi:hypothetical protein